MTNSQKSGGLLFFGKAGCVGCHAVGGQSNEMFSDFKMHVAGVPQIAPAFGVGKGNVEFDGPGKDENFGLEQITGTSLDRYKFRTSPLRNAALQPAFFHNGAYTRLEEAIRFHINTNNAARNYNAAAAGVDVDLRGRLGPIEPVLQRLDPKLVVPISLSPSEFSDLVTFVRDGLLDRAALKENLCKLAPSRVPSGLRTMVIEGCGDNDDER